MNRQQFEIGCKRLYIAAWAVSVCVLIGGAVSEGHDPFVRMMEVRTERQERSAFVQMKMEDEIAAKRKAEGWSSDPVLRQKQERADQQAHAQIPLAVATEAKKSYGFVGLNDSDERRVKEIAWIFLAAALLPGVAMLIIRWVYRGFMRPA